MGSGWTWRHRPTPRRPPCTAPSWERPARHPSSRCRSVADTGNAADRPRAVGVLRPRPARVVTGLDRATGRRPVARPVMGSKGTRTRHTLQRGLLWKRHAGPHAVAQLRRAATPVVVGALFAPVACQEVRMGAHATEPARSGSRQSTEHAHAHADEVSPGSARPRGSAGVSVPRGRDPGERQP